LSGWLVLAGAPFAPGLSKRLYPPHGPTALPLPVKCATGRRSLLSPAYITRAVPICFILFTHEIRFARSFALDNAGRSIAARIAMIAMTTSSSIKVKPRAKAGPRARANLSELIMCISRQSSGRCQGFYAWQEY
jgi:hypothetical protein